MVVVDAFPVVVELGMEVLAVLGAIFFFMNYIGSVHRVVFGCFEIDGSVT